jgi:hypothetical protein
LVIRRRAVVVLGALFLVLVISQFLRDALFRIALGQQLDFFGELIRSQSYWVEYGDISYFYRASLEAIHQNINNHFLIPLGVARRILFFYLPASYSGGLKVEDIAATFSDVVDGGDAQRRGNMPTGLFGLFVISFGWFASMFLIPCLVLILRKLDTVFRRSSGVLRTAALSVFVFSVVLSFRGDDSSGFYFTVSTAMFLGVAQLGRRLMRPVVVLSEQPPSVAASAAQDPV